MNFKEKYMMFPFPIVKPVKYLHLSFILVLLAVIPSCEPRSEGKVEPKCPPFDWVPASPYDDPVWHPAGQIIGFNHRPIKEIKYSYGYDCPRQASYAYHEDSLGFWLINADGTGKRRVLPYSLITPSWSPDGRWIAFVRDAQVYKMPFDGERFDTTALVQLTASGRNFFPAWSPDGNWIAYDSNTDSPTGLSFIWKMRSDGSAKSRIAFTPNAGETRAPSWGKDFSIVHERYIGIVSTEIFTMDSAGNQVTRLTFNENQDSYSQYAPDGEHIGYISQSNKADGIGLYTKDLTTGATQRVSSHDILNFSWSPDGRIVFLRYDYSCIDQVQGTLWVMDADGSNLRQLTYNQFQITQ